MKSPIVVLPHTVLRATARPVEEREFGSPELMRILEQMTIALRATDDGIGIAAPQIGVSKRIFLASEEALAIDKGIGSKDEDVKQKKKKVWKYYVFINPEVLKISTEKAKASEGCLSVPKKYGIVERAQKVKIRAYDERGKKFERGASNLFARLLQHELDHLEGKLFIDTAEKIVTVSKSEF
jgi:peptide deformylase